MLYAAEVLRNREHLACEKRLMLFLSFMGIINGSLEQVQGEVKGLLDLFTGAEITITNQ